MIDKIFDKCAGYCWLIVQFMDVIGYGLLLYYWLFFYENILK